MRMRPAVLAAVVVSCAFAQGRQDHWVATWTTPQPLFRNPVAGGGRGPANPSQAINARGFHDQTVRMIVHTSIGGSKLRIKLASPFGSTPVKIGTAHVALRSKESEIVAASDRPLSFNGKPGCTLGPGMVILSDPVNLTAPGQGDLAVSLYLPGETGPPASHNGLHTAYVSKEGDVTGAASIPDATPASSYYWLSAVDVLADSKAAVIVTLGDSITEGARSTPDTDRMWPAVLASRLAGNKKTAEIAVANMGIGGNRVLRDGAGASALARLDRDVISQSGVKWLMLLEGINDIGREVATPAEATTAEELIAAYRQIIERAHTHGIKVIGCTLTPYGGAGYQRDTGEAVRSAVNEFIRTGRAFDAVVDFEAATRDPQNPKKLRAEFDHGDHLHPNDAGYQAMADAVDLGIFTGKRAGK